MFLKRITTIALGSALLTAATVAAQPSSGDIVMSAAFGTPATEGAFYMPLVGNNLSTLVSGTELNSCQTAYAALGIVCANVGNPAVTRFSGTGTTSTLTFGFPGQVHAMDLDQQANYVAAAGNTSSYGIYKMTAGGSVSTVTTLGVAINGICRDNESGGYAYCTGNGNNRLYHYNARTGSTSTLRTLGSTGSGVCYMNDVNRYAVSTFGSNALEICTRSGALVTTVPTPGGVGQAVCYDDLNRRLFCVTNAGYVIELNNRGLVIATRQYTGYNFTGVDIWNDHSTNLNTSGDQGTRAFINIRHPDSGGAIYCAAIALNNQPGLGIDTRWQAIAPDPLFFLTVCGALPAFTNGFTGTLNSSGAATASFTIPFEAPLGTMIYAVSSAVNASFPSSLDLGVPEGILVQ